MSNQFNLEFVTEIKSGPVECLGQTFPSEEARREHFTELLREKLKDPEFRKIEGFPIGEDEDILALSDPPYYTACPNPWIGDFIKCYGRPYDPKEKYHREPFAADVSEGKNHPIYNAHSYHTKVPHRAIMRYILHYTEPGDVVFDGFCGTGMTGVAAQLCGDEKEVRELGYRVDADGTIYNDEGTAFSKLGIRHAVLNDLSPAATFIAYNYNTPIDAMTFKKEAKRILDEVEEECGWMYDTKHTDGEVGKVNCVVWSDIFACQDCGTEIILWKTAVDHENGKTKDTFLCPNCKSELSKNTLDRVWESKFDMGLGEIVKAAKQAPVSIVYVYRNKRFQKEPDDDDLRLISQIEKLKSEDWFPVDTLPDGFNTRQPRMSHGASHMHHFFTARNLKTLAAFRKRIIQSPLRHPLLYQLDSLIIRQSRRTRLLVSYFFHGGGGWVGTPLSGTLYFPSFSVEVQPFDTWSNRLSKTLERVLQLPSSITSTTSSSTSTSPECSHDYIFLDPPFGSNLNYSELNFLWESWFKVKTNNIEEAIENKVQGKSLDQYRQLMTKCFREAYRILKPGRWMTVEFSNTKSAVWNSIQTALTEVGFIVANVSALDKKQGSFKAVTSNTAVKQDLVISAYKPNGGLEKRFAKNGDSVEGVWDFLQTHLRNLPVIKPRAGQLERIAERDPRILYDRLVAFYIGHNTPVPLSSGEFQAALAEKFPERDGMVFLAEQVAEYDKKASQMENVGQMSIFVEDEKSAINWLRQFLKDRPSVQSDITPEFMQQLSASWKKFETRPELSLLLDQNFIQYKGEGEIPSQIHSYLSTNFKDLRSKAKDDPTLKAKAKDRWFVPDPKKAIDVEAIRDKRLLSEFWNYAEQAGVTRRKPGDPNQATLPLPSSAVKKAKVKKLKEVRTEAIRAGFLQCHQSKDAATILAVAEILPNNVIEEDEQLQMIYDMAEMRAG